MKGKILYCVSPKVHAYKWQIKQITITYMESHLKSTIDYGTALTLFIYRIAVNGILNEQNNKSDMHSDRTKAVVACPLNFWCCSNAIIVMRLPVEEEMGNIYSLCSYVFLCKHLKRQIICVAKYRQRHCG